MAALSAVFCNLLLLAGEAEFSTERISFEISLPLKSAVLPVGSYLVSGNIFEKNKALGSFYRIPRLIVPCKEPPCWAKVTAEVPMKNVTAEMIRAVLLKKCRVHFRTAFKSAGRKTISESDISVDLSPEAMGIGEESAEYFIRIENQAVTPKNHAFTFDLVLQNPFSFPLKLRSVHLKATLVAQSEYDQTFEFNEDLPSGETTKTLSIPLKPGDILYLISDKLLQEDYTLNVKGRLEGTIKVEMAGQTVEVPFGGQ